MSAPSEKGGSKRRRRDSPQTQDQPEDQVVSSAEQSRTGTTLESRAVGGKKAKLRPLSMSATDDDFTKHMKCIKAFEEEHLKHVEEVQDTLLHITHLMETAEKQLISSFESLSEHIEGKYNDLEELKKGFDLTSKDLNARIEERKVKASSRNELLKEQKNALQNCLEELEQDAKDSVEMIKQVSAALGLAAGN